MEEKIKDIGTVELITDPKDDDTVIAERDGHTRRVKVSVLATKVGDNASSDVAAAKEAAESANAAAEAATAAQKSLESDVSGLLAAQGSYAYYAAGRVAGASSATFSKTYGTREGLLAALAHLKVGTIKDGELQHEFAPGRCTLATNGDTVAIDGTDGDVCLFTDIDLHKLRNRGTVGSDTCNMMGLGLVPYLVGSMSSVKYKPFFMAADYTVNAKLDGDTRSQAHCIYNESVAGTYTAASAYFKQTYKASGNGYPNGGISSLNSSAQARNKNADTNSSTPYQGLHFNWEEVWWEAMCLELGSLDITAATNFGTGCTNTAATASTWADTAMSGVSGMKMITSAGAESYGGLWSSNLQIGTSGKAVSNLVAIVGSCGYVFLQQLVHLRIFDNITKNGLTSYVGNSSAIFTGLGTGVVTDGSVNLSTGAGMTANTFYCQVRNAPNCQGIADGVMSGVINMYIMLECSDDVYLSGGSTSMKGGKVIFKFSLPVYRGKAFFKGMFTQLEGLYYLMSNPSGTVMSTLYSVDNPADIRVINTSTGYADGKEDEGILKGLTKRWTRTASDGWIKDTDYSVSLFAHQTTGGGQHTYECGYLWNTSSWGGPHTDSSTGKVSQGYTCTNASAAGCSASAGSAGRTLDANVAVTFCTGSYAGAFAGFLKQAAA